MRNDAKLLVQSISIQQGFSRQFVEARKALLVATGLEPSFTSPVANKPANTVELAITELRLLARTVGQSLAVGIANRPQRNATPGLHPSAIRRRPAHRPTDTLLRTQVDALFLWLQASEYAEAGLPIDALSGVEGAFMTFPAHELACAAPSLLAAGVALQELRYFLHTSRDLLLEPLGSLKLFHATAALDSAGLGPYFRNVAQIARRSANLFELGSIAEAASGAGIGEEIWAVLLSRHVTGGMREEIIDDLGDRGCSFALQIMLERALAWPESEIDQAIVTRIRDAALDNLDYETAGKAQCALVALKPQDWSELRILAAIDASAGHVMAAEQRFASCLAQDPSDEDLKAQMNANRLRQYAVHALTKGLESPPDRQLRRLSRRASIT